MHIETESAVMERVNWIKQVAATMQIEDLAIDNRTYGHLRQIAAGEKTAEQAVREIRKEYMHG